MCLQYTISLNLKKMYASCAEINSHSNYACLQFVEHHNVQGRITECNQFWMLNY